MSKKNIFIVTNRRLTHTGRLILRTNLLQVLVFLLFFPFGGWNVGAQGKNNLAPALQSKMIWSGSDDGKPGYTVFRKTFNLEDFEEAKIQIFADARYLLWVNGTEVLRGPCRFDPVAPSYDSKEITSFLKQGKNAVVVMVMSHGSNGKMMNHEPGLAAGIEITGRAGVARTLWSDDSWKWTNKTRFLPPVQNWGVVCDRIDARIDDGDWSQADYDDSGWKHAVPVDGGKWGALSPRAIPLLAEKEMGWVALNKTNLPVGLKSGQSYIIKANEMLQGYPIIQFESEKGVTIQFDFGYTGDSLNVGESYGSSCIYTASDGEQVFIPTDSYGFRYLKISVLNGSIYSPHNMLIKQIKLIDRRYPYDETGSFNCDDTFLNDLWKRSALTLKLNCEDGYMDCALREKVEWMGDAAIVEYPLSRSVFAYADSAGVPRSDSGLIISMLRHIAQSQSDSGLLKAHHPSDRFDIHAYIEDYTCLWVQALREVFERTGNTGLVRELWEPLKKQMKWFESHRTSNGLVFGREFTFIDNPLAYCRCEGATLNAFVYKAFCDAAFLARQIGDSKTEKEYKKIAGDLFTSYNTYLWIPSKQTYSSGLYKGKQMMPTAHAETLALNRGIVPENRINRVREYLFAHYLDRGKGYPQGGIIPDSFFDHDLKTQGIDSPYTAFWFLEELYNDSRDAEALSFIRKRWAKMMSDTIAGTLWEGFGGGDLCHNMGAVPAYFLSTKVLGVSEKLPVSSKVIEIRPQLGDLKKAEGTVVTVHGLVQLKWEKLENGLAFSIDIPEKTQAEVVLPFNNSSGKIDINGKHQTCRIKNNKLAFTIKSDVIEGRISVN